MPYILLDVSLTEGECSNEISGAAVIAKLKYGLDLTLRLEELQFGLDNIGGNTPTLEIGAPILPLERTITLLDEVGGG
jgi:hypothetical protein